MTEREVQQKHYHFGIPEDEIGKGGCGKVYRATCITTQKKVAVKRIEIPFPEETFKTMFNRQMSLLIRYSQSKKNSTLKTAIAEEYNRCPYTREQLNLYKILFLQINMEIKANQLITENTHIVRTIKMFKTERSVLFVQELMGDEVFDAFVAEGCYLNETNIRGVIKSLLSGLRHLHCDLNIIHRDIKLENLLMPLHQPGNTTVNFAAVKLMDFGFAARPEDCNTWMGTLFTSAYETFIDKPNFSKASDMWSVGVVLYVLLQGKYPFNGTDIETKKAIRSNRFIMGGIEWETRSDLSKNLVMKLLRSRPEHRWTVEQALDHPWFHEENVENKDTKSSTSSSSSASSTTSSSSSSSGMKAIAHNFHRLNIHRKFQRAVRRLIYEKLHSLPPNVRIRNYLLKIRTKREHLKLGSNEMLELVSTNEEENPTKSEPIDIIATVAQAVLACSEGDKKRKRNDDDRKNMKVAKTSSDSSSSSSSSSNSSSSSKVQRKKSHMAAHYSTELLQTHFNQFDQDRDGNISTSELGEVMNSLAAVHSMEATIDASNPPTTVELQDLFNQYDSDQNGTINFNEFLAMMKSIVEEEELIEAFNFFDEDNSGLIDGNELRHVLVTMLSDLSDGDVQELMNEIDVDNDGNISQDEFLKMMRKTQ